MITKANAQKLVSSAKVSLADFYEAIKKIIEKEAWVPLGYEGFTELYDAEFSGLPLAEEMKPTIVYAMIEDKATDFQISKAIPGVGPEKIKSARRQKKSGIPASKASLTFVQEHIRGPRETHWVRARITSAQQEDMKAIGVFYEQTMEEMVLEAIEAFIEKYRIDEVG